jgi:hypothetical protein
MDRKIRGFNGDNQRLELKTRGWSDKSDDRAENSRKSAA